MYARMRRAMASGKQPTLAEEHPMSDQETGGKSYILEASPGRFNLTGHEATLHVITYPQKLLSLAQSLIDSGEYSVSIVVAHMACEVAVDRTFTEAYKVKGIEYLEKSIESFLPSNNLGNDGVRKLYTALTGDEIQKQPFWQRFTDSAKRRNNISHNGATYEKPEAETSLAVAKDFVKHLNK